MREATIGQRVIAHCYRCDRACVLLGSIAAINNATRVARIKADDLPGDCRWFDGAEHIRMPLVNCVGLADSSLGVE